jgi:protein-S-isoprenylcysteine O-methyltransferase Ste14
MILSYSLLIVSILWILSEILLAIITYSRTEHSKIQDRSSFRYLWIIILMSIMIGMFVGTTGYGFVRTGNGIIAKIGFVLILIGLIVRWCAIISLRKYFTVNVSIRNTHQLVARGIYQYVRHPSYAGSLLSFFGLGITFSNWLVTIIIFFPILFAFLRRIRIEEDVLRKYFGETYDQYSKNTSRLIPKIY